MFSLRPYLILLWGIEQVRIHTKVSRISHIMFYNLKKGNDLDDVYAYPNSQRAPTPPSQFPFLTTLQTAVKKHTPTHN